MIEAIEYRTGQLDYYGQMWTWVSGAEVVAATLTVVGSTSPVYRAIASGGPLGAGTAVTGSTSSVYTVSSRDDAAVEED
jgi:hypothetical protein